MTWYLYSSYTPSGGPVAASGTPDTNLQGSGVFDQIGHVAVDSANLLQYTTLTGSVISPWTDAQVYRSHLETPSDFNFRSVFSFKYTKDVNHYFGWSTADHNTGVIATSIESNAGVAAGETSPPNVGGLFIGAGSAITALTVVSGTTAFSAEPTLNSTLYVEVIALQQSSTKKRITQNVYSDAGLTTLLKSNVWDCDTGLATGTSAMQNSQLRQFLFSGNFNSTSAGGYVSTIFGVAAFKTYSDIAPTVSVSPTSGTVVDSSTTLSITPSHSGSLTGLTATVSGGGTLSTSSPASGTPFVYTPPASGSGTATVTVTDGAGVSAVCMVGYAPSGSPAMGVSPPTASSNTPGGTVSITATETGTSAALTASVSGGGTISTTAPVSGTPFTWTQPATGSGVATVTVVDSTDSITHTCVITWNSAALSVSPTTATAVVGGANLAITPTLTGSSASLSASVSGGGTLSTSSPTSGTSFNWTPPSSGSGTATVTVIDSADSKMATCTITYGAASQTIYANDSKLRKSPTNWKAITVGGHPALQAVCAGSYIGGKFNGTALAIGIDTTGNSGNQCFYRLEVTGQEPVMGQITLGQTVINTTGLSLGDYEFELMLFARNQAQATWDGSQSLKVVSFTPSGGTGMATAASRPNRMIGLADSIGEGLSLGPTTDSHFAVTNSGFSGADTTAGAAFSFVHLLGHMLNAEFDQACFGGTDWATGYGIDAPSAMQALANNMSGSARDSSAMQAMTHVIFNHGTNGAPTTGQVVAGIQAARTACPTALIFVFVPFIHGSIGAAVAAGFAAYQTAAPSDAKVFLVDAGSLFGGLSNYYVSVTSGPHPTPLGHARMAANYFGAMLPTLQAAAAGGTIPSATDVRFGAAVGSGTGLAHIPTPAQTLLGVAVNATVGTVTLPDIASVQAGITFGPALSLTGTYASSGGGGGGGVYPIANQVRNGVVFGPTSNLTGSLVLPSANRVLAGFGYGAGGVEFTGTYSVSLPSANQVLAGVSFGASSVGTFVAPDESAVQFGVHFGVSSVGQYTGETQALTVEAMLDGFSRIIPLDAPKGSYAEALLAARSSVFGTRSEVNGNITYRAPDGVTVLKTVQSNSDGSVISEPQV